jgi:hypothetical protein
VALCGVARLKSSSLVISIDQEEPLLPTHQNMLQMILAKRPSNNYSDNFDEVMVGAMPERKETQLIDLKDDKRNQETAVYDNLVCCRVSGSGRMPSAVD